MAPPRSTSAAPIALQREQPSKFGTQLTPDGVRFRLWAPQCNSVKIDIDGEVEAVTMNSLPRGWHEVEVVGIRAGARYHFVLPDGQHVPDPASRHQPLDVDGPSEVIDPRAFGWTDVGWTSRPWVEAVIYELHIGTFTKEGSFRGGHRPARLPRRARHHRDRTHADRGLPRSLEMGLRWSPAVCPGLRLWPSRGPESPR